MSSMAATFFRIKVRWACVSAGICTRYASRPANCGERAAMGEVPSMSTCGRIIWNPQYDLVI